MERVWRLLTDFASYPRWNPFIRRASGKPEKGAHPEVYLQPEGAKGMTFHPRVLTAEPGRELRWLGHLLISGLFDGEHIFIIEPLIAGGVRFIQREKITGLLVLLFAHRLDTETRRGFEDMNQALKMLAEGESQKYATGDFMLNPANGGASAWVWVAPQRRQDNVDQKF